MQWIIIYDKGTLNPRDLALSDLGDFPFIAFIVYNEDQVFLLYEPTLKRCTVFMDDQPIQISATGRPFFYWANKVTAAFNGDTLKMQRKLMFGVTDAVTCEEKDGDIEVTVYV